MGKSKRFKNKSIGSNEEYCESCRAQRDMATVVTQGMLHPRNSLKKTAVFVTEEFPILKRTKSKPMESDSEDSAIETASIFSDNVSLDSISDISSFDDSGFSSSTSEKPQNCCVTVSIKSVEDEEEEEEIDLDSLAEFVTGFPLQRFTHRDNCMQCINAYNDALHMQQHCDLATLGLPDTFSIDLTGKDIEFHVDYAQYCDNGHNNFCVSPQGATYYSSVSNPSDLALLPKETMIPPSEKAMFDATHPPQRPWIPLAHPERNKPTALFTVMCYNVLCDKYCTRQLYGYSPSWSLHWDYRKKGILEEIRHYNADIVSLQEVETEQFYNFFLPELERDGYQGIFDPKSRARTMGESEAKYVDGCAIFWKSNKFSLLTKHLIEFNQLAIANAEGSENILNRVMTKDNIGLCAILETKEEVWENGLPITDQVRRPLLVATAHVVWDPEFCDVKLIQSMMMMHEIKNFVENSQLSLRPGASKLDCTQMPMILCGDLNSLPDSGVVEFLSNSKVSVDHLDFKEIDYEQVLNTFSHTNDNDYLTHAFKLKQAYEGSMLEFTNYTYDFKGVIDYIFYTENHMKPLGVLGPMDKEWFRENKVVGCPHPHIPSDHISLLVEYELPAAGSASNQRGPTLRR